MSAAQPFDELMTRTEKTLDQAKADPQAFLENHEAIESLAADSSERDLLINELNSRLKYLYAESDSVAKILAKTAFEKGLVFDKSLQKLLLLLDLNSPRESKHA
jgi:ATP:corrinoid adenosyltransferase